jgi:zinc protease
MTTASLPRPAATAPRPYRFPSFERRTLSNGVNLVIAPVTKLPVVSIMVVVDAGATTDPEGKEGLALLTARALIEGTERRDGASLAVRAESLGAELKSRADWDAALLELTVLSARLDDALELVGEVLTQPVFPEREIARLRSERLAEVLQLRAEPRGLADEMLERFVYAPDARYSHPEGGSERSVARLRRDDVVEFYRARYQPRGVTLVVVGDVTVNDVMGMAEAALGGWRTSGAAPQAAAPDRPARLTPAMHIVTKTDAPQSELRVGHVGVPRTHPDYFPILVMNAVLGGLFSSRINLNLREAHGYTYGAHSSFDWRRGSGPFSVDTAVRSDITDKALAEVLREIERIRADSVTEDERSLVTSYLDGVFPIRYETAAAIATALANLVIYGLPDDFYDQYRAHVRDVSAIDILAAARAHLQPSRLQVVVVGDPATIREPLERMQVGPVSVYDDSGRPL